jgi:hypothetical protein
MEAVVKVGATLVSAQGPAKMCVGRAAKATLLVVFLLFFGM